MDNRSTSSIDKGKILDQEVVERVTRLKEENKKLKIQISEHSQTQDILQARLRFEKLLLELSERFINIYGDAVEQEIEKSLQEITVYFEVDRSSFFKFSEARKEFQLLHFYSMPGVKKAPPSVFSEKFPWVFQKLIQNQIVIIPCTEELPDDARVDKKSFPELGLKSLLAIPLKAGGKLQYAFSISSLHSRNDWPEELAPRLKLLGEIFVNASMRKSARDFIEKRLQFEELVTDIVFKFSSSPLNDINELTNDTLRRVGDFLGAERCGLGLFSEDKTIFINRYGWVSQGGRLPSIYYGQLPPEMHWFLKQTLNGKVLTVEIDNLPTEAGEARKAFLLRENIKSVLIVPMQVERDVIGNIVFDTVTEKRTWPDELVKRLCFVASVIATALIRKRISQSLEATKSLMNTFMEYSPAFMYIKDKSRKNLFANRPFLEYFNITLDEFIGTTSYDYLPEDAARIMDEYDNKVLEEGRMFEIDNLNTQIPGQTLHIRDIKFPVTLESGDTGIGGIVIDITAVKEKEVNLQKAFDKIKNLQNQLEQENVFLKKEIKLLHIHDEIVGKSRVITSMLGQAEKVAEQDTTVLIQGETGTGKELLARAIHKMSPRSDRPMIVVNCASLPATLIEGELFGREKGAYTGALTKQAGRFELANKSTIFLDEVGDLTLDMQAKLLRVLQEGKFERLGSTKTITVDVRVIAATNHNLEQAVAVGKFRKDLFYRLSVFPITVPPLRDRKKDIALLVWFFVKLFSKKMGKTVDLIPKNTMKLLENYPWHGNVRELRNVIERAMILHTGVSLAVQMQSEPGLAEVKPMLLQDIERDHILSMLNNTGWKVSGKNGAAEMMGLKESTLRAKMKKLGIKRTSQFS